jgi:hypothetical protein
MKLFSLRFSPSARPRPTFRPQLEAFEDRCVPAVIVADIPGQGIVRFTDGQPQLLTSGQASKVCADAAGDVLADFGGGLGLWRYEDRTGWQQLAPFDTFSLDIRGDGKVVARFIQWGIWEYQDGTGWQELVGPPALATLFPEVKIDDTGGVLANSQGAMWYHPNGGSWQGVIGLETTTFDIAGNGEMVFDFSELGVWRYHQGGNWEQQTPLDAAFVKVNAAGAVAVAILPVGGVAQGGIFVRGPGSPPWGMLTPNATCNALGLGGDGSVAASYQADGLWYWSSDGTPTLLSAQGPDAMSYQD